MSAPDSRPTWPGLLNRLLAGHDLLAADTAWAMREIMTGEATPAQTAAFVVALRAKGEAPDEVAGLAATMIEQATPVDLPLACVDIVGTGGDNAHTVNISSMAAVVTAATGVPVAKHGNRAASSSSGSADVLEALGVVIDLPAPAVAQCVREAGIGFFFAPVFHPGFRFTAAPRREMGIGTVFNFLGPLTNPAGATRQLIGVSDPAYLETMAGALRLLGTKHALLVSSEDGLDELSISAPTRVVEVIGSELRSHTVSPQDVGLTTAPPEHIPGGDPAQNAQTARSIFAGEPGASRDLAVLNAGAAIYAGGGADTLEAGVRAAEQAIDEGAAAAALERFVQRTQELAS